MPVVTDAKTVTFAQKFWHGMSTFRRGAVDMDLDGKKFKLQLQKGQLKESSPQGTWNITGRTLTMNYKQGGKNFTKTGSPNELYTSLVKANVDVSPFSRYLLTNRVPFLDLFNQPISVKYQGIISANQVPLKIFKIQRSGTDIMLYVDPNDRLHVMSSSAKDRNGNVVQGSKLTLTYL
jgi:hypothetical protein